MRKKELSKLFEETEQKAELFSMKIESLKAELEDTLFVNEKLQAEIKKLSQQKSNPDDFDIKSQENTYIENNDIADSEFKLSADTNLGAAAIGKVVIAATKSSNILTSIGDTDEIKELINLILGRTEVAKAEILKIISLESELQVKKEMIDREVEAAEDYFISVRGQII